MKALALKGAEPVSVDLQRGALVERDPVIEGTPF